MAKFLNDGAAQAMDDRNRADAKPEGKTNINNFCIPCSLFVYCYALKVIILYILKVISNEINVFFSSKLNFRICTMYLDCVIAFNGFWSV